MTKYFRKKNTLALIVASLAYFFAVNDVYALKPCPIIQKADSTQQKALPIDGCLPDDPPPPVQTPGTPSNISYAPYTNSDSLTINWGTSKDYGQSIKYQLFQRVGNNSWSKVYDGYSRSYEMTSKNQAILTYRVRSCFVSDSTKCSNYRTGSKMAFNPMPETNLYQKYPVLHEVDDKIFAHQTTAKSFKTVIPRLSSAGKLSSSSATAKVSGLDLDPSENRFYLGDGYDLIRGALRETCLKVDDPNFEIVQSAPLLPDTFEVSYVHNNQELAELLDVSASATAGFTYDDFSLGLSGEKSRYVNSLSDDSHVRFVVKWVQRAEYWKLNTPTDAILAELVSDILQPLDEEAKADFRERCGDVFINSANLGAALYMVFSFDAKKFDFQEKENKKSNLGIALEDIFNVGAAQSISTETKLLLDELNVKIYADQVGGPDGLAASINSDNFNDKYNEFIQGINSENVAAVDISTSNYQRPTVYNDYPHSDIFANYSAPYAHMKRWLDLTVQHAERCSPYADYGRPVPSVCGTSQAELSIALDMCRETRQWFMCGHPSQYYTGSFTLGSEGTYLFGWLSDNVKKLNANDVTKDYSHHVHKGSKKVNDPTCLKHNQCFANTFRGSGAGINKGFEIRVHYYDNPKGTSPKYNLSNSNNCVKTTADLITGGFLGDTTADLNYTVYFEGICPDVEDFVLIP